MGGSTRVKPEGFQLLLGARPKNTTKEEKEINTITPNSDSQHSILAPSTSQFKEQQTIGPVGSNHGSLGPVPAPVARGCHSPHNTLLLAL